MQLWANALSSHWPNAGPTFKSTLLVPSGSLANQVILLQAKCDSATSPLLLTREVKLVCPRLSCKH